MSFELQLDHAHSNLTGGSQATVIDPYLVHNPAASRVTKAAMAPPEDEFLLSWIGQNAAHSNGVE